MACKIKLEPADEEEIERPKVDDTPPVQYEPIPREDISLNLPLSVLGSTDKPDATITLVISDLHIGDSDFLPDTFTSCVDKTKLALRHLSNLFNIKNFILVLNGDIVSGRDVYRYQHLRNLLQRGHWQLELGAHVIRELHTTFASIKPIDKTFVLKGNHECYDQDTEILTRDGFKTYDSTKVGEEALTYNKETHSYEWNRIENLKIEDYSGPMLLIDYGFGTQCLTPNHRCIFKDATRSKYIGKEVIREIRASNLNKTKWRKSGVLTDLEDKWRLLNNIKWEGVKSGYTQKELQLIAWLITEGSREQHTYGYRYSVCQKNINYLEEIDKLLTRMELSYSKRMLKNGTFLWRFRKKSNLYITKLLGGYWKEVPRKILDAPIQELELFYDTLIKGDGSLRESRGSVYYTASPNIRDDVQEIILKLGRQTSYYTRGPTLFEGYVTRGDYIVYNRCKSGSIKSIDEIEYTGKIWCPTVKNGYVVMRRDTTPFISGNSLGENYMIYLTNYLDDTWYGGHYKVLNIAYPIGNYNVLFTHGFGRSEYYPVGYGVIRDCWKSFNQYRTKGVQIEEICVAHSIPGHRNVVIKTDNGMALLPIEQCPETFETLTINEQEQPEWNYALKYFHPYQGKMITAVTSAGEIEVTTGHSIFVYDNGQMIIKKGNDLEVGDRLIHLKHIPYQGSKQSITAEDAWVLGFYCADGWTSKFKRGSSTTYSVGFANLDITIIERIKEYFATKYPTKHVVERSITYTKGGLHQIQVYNKDAYSYFSNVCGTGSKAKKVPSAIFNSIPEIRDAFIEGYYTGDGEKAASYRWGSSSSLLFDGVTTLLKMKDPSKVWHGTHTTYRQYTTLRKDTIRKDHLRGSWVGDTYKSDIEDHGSFYTSAIKKLSYRDYDDMVYDLEVPGNPMFFDARGMTLLHNTHWLQPRLYIEGLTFNVTGGFQRWEKTISQRPSGFLLMLHTKGETSVTGIKPDPETEAREQSASDLEFTNLEFYSRKLRDAIAYLREKDQPNEIVL